MALDPTQLDFSEAIITKAVDCLWEHLGPQFCKDFEEVIDGGHSRHFHEELLERLVDVFPANYTRGTLEDVEMTLPSGEKVHVKSNMPVDVTADLTSAVLGQPATPSKLTPANWVNCPSCYQHITSKHLPTCKLGK